MARRTTGKKPIDVGIFGDLTDNEVAIFQGLLEVEDGAACRLFINSCGGSAYVAMGIVALLTHKRLRPTAIVLGECMSATMLVFAACRQRLAAPNSCFLFHPLRWQSREETVHAEALSWAREFARLENETDELLARYLHIDRALLDRWTREHRYLSGTELAKYGLCELYELGPSEVPLSSRVRPGRRR